MKVTCTACQAPYTIADEKVPPQGARVRCRKCQTVFSIPAHRGTPEPAPPAGAGPVAAAPAASVPAAAASAPRPAASAEMLRPAPLPTIPPAGEPLTPPPAREPGAGLAGLPGQKLSPIPEGLPPEEHSKHERARRLARVLASDIAIYNKEKRDRGMRDGNLVAVLGYEIKKSWEVYKERVTPDLANSTPYFRDALNEMLAEGKKVF